LAPFFLLLPFILAVVHPLPIWAQPERLIVIDKASQILILYTSARFPMVFPVSLGVDPVSDKRRRGDCATPEGLYRISHKKMSKKFHQFIGLSYPNATDACEALIRDIITRDECSRIRSAQIRSLPPPDDTPLGNHIGIHGGGVVNLSDGKAATNWTEGCIAMENDHIGSVFSAVDPGDPILIFHSGKDLYGMLRPLTSPCDTDPSSGVCPDGIYRGEAVDRDLHRHHPGRAHRFPGPSPRSLTCRLYTDTDAKDPAVFIEGPGRRRVNGGRSTASPEASWERRIHPRSSRGFVKR